MRPESKGEGDRRVVRTRRSLHDALISLILEKGFENVTVQAVCEKADVGRSTFYVHFADTEELLLSGFDHLKHALRSMKGDGPLGFARPLIVHAGENRRLFRALVGRKSGHFVQVRFRELVAELIDEDLKKVPKGVDRDAAVRATAGAFCELVMWWSEGRTKLTADELASSFEVLCAPLLA